MDLKRAHLIIGIIGLLIFVLQGQYMARVLVVPELHDTQRMLYRSGHLYLMLASGINIALGCFMPTGPASWLQRLCSALLLLAPLLLLGSFFVEVNEQSIDRVMTSLGLYAIFGAVALLATRAIVQTVTGSERE